MISTSSLAISSLGRVKRKYVWIIESIGVFSPIIGRSRDYVKRLGGWCETRRKEKSEEQREKKKERKISKRRGRAETKRNETKRKKHDVQISSAQLRSDRERSKVLTP